jgi:hypothetical protein
MSIYRSPQGKEQVLKLYNQNWVALELDLEHSFICDMIESIWHFSSLVCQRTYCIEEGRFLYYDLFRKLWNPSNTSYRYRPGISSERANPGLARLVQTHSSDFGGLLTHWKGKMNFS